MVDITKQIKDIIAKSGIKSGLCTVFVPHTTAGVTLNENADPDVVHDFTYAIDKLIPWEDGYRHAEGNSAAHLKASLTGFSQTLIIENSSPLLGVWQDVYLCEYDGPRSRSVYVKAMD